MENMLFFSTQEWNERAALPNHVITMLNNFPSNLHPMSQFSASITALNSESKFAKAYSEGVHKSKYWQVLYASFSFVISIYFRQLFSLFKEKYNFWLYIGYKFYSTVCI